MSWGQTDPVSGLGYEIINNEVRITWIGNSPSDVVIPEKIEGLPVTSIDGFAFEDNDITSVQIPSTVTVIYLGAFRGTAISEITIPASVNMLGSYAFGFCNNLKTITLQYSGDLLDYAFEILDDIPNLQTIYVPKGMKEAYSTRYPKYADIIQEKEMTPSGISKVSSDTSNNQHSAAIYSIDGKLVSKDGNTTGIAKGIYIQNGKKVVIK